jgi:hypothetical protein
VKYSIEDAKRWHWLVKNINVGLGGASENYDAVLRIPTYNADDTTLEQIVDRAMKEKDPKRVFLWTVNGFILSL